MVAKANPDRRHPKFFRKALLLAGGDKQTAFSKYIQLHYRAIGSLAPGCNAKDFQAMADRVIALQKLSTLCNQPLESFEARFTEFLSRTPLGFWDAIQLCNERAQQGLPLPFDTAPAGGNGDGMDS
jgi:hypothetical protein